MRFIKEILKGILIGIANAIPGVSGGTMMVSMGIYDKIIFSVTHLFKQFKKSVLILLPYIIGMGVGIVGLSFGIEFLFQNYPMQTALLFIGLIVGGIPVIFGHLKGKVVKTGNIIAFLFFFALIIGLQLLGKENGKEVILSVSMIQMLKLFFIGILASATMVIPGVSGSMILMLLGYYNPIISTITEFVKSAAAFEQTGILQGIGILAPFGVGIVIGIFAIAKVIEILLKKQEGMTYSAILGLIIASPFAVLMQIGIPALNFSILLTSGVAFVIGFGVAFFLGRE